MLKGLNIEHFCDIIPKAQSWLVLNYQFSCLFKLQLHDAIYRLRFYSNSLTHIILLSSSHNKVASIQKNRGDKLHCVIVALHSFQCTPDQNNRFG